MGLLVCDGASVEVGGTEVLSSIDLTLGSGEALGLIGGAGSGKSRLLRAIAGLSMLSAGRILFLGKDASLMDRHVAARFGLRLVSPGDLLFPSLTVREHFRLAQGGARTADLSSPRLTSIAEAAHKPGFALSGGMQRALALEMAVRSRPRLLLIDDFAEGLQPRMVDEAVAMLRDQLARGTSIIAVDRSLTVLERFCARILLLRGGTKVEEWRAPVQEPHRSALLNRVFS